MNRDEIPRKLEENNKAIRGFGVRRLGVFGSYARGDEKEAGYIDFLVGFDDATLQNYLDLKEFLECLLSPSGNGRKTLAFRRRLQ